MVTDIAAYIGTSNWSGDYFIDTAGKLLQYRFYENKITQIKVVIKFYICRFYKLFKILNTFFYYFFLQKFILMQIFEFRYRYRIRKRWTSK